MRICPGFRLVAEPRSDVGDRADGGIVEAALEADGAEGGKPVRDADAEADVVPQTTPLLCQRPDGAAHFKRHQDSLKRGVLDWNRIIEDHHHSVASVAF